MSSNVIALERSGRSGRSENTTPSFFFTCCETILCSIIPLLLGTCFCFQVRHAPRRRAAPRPSQGKPHTIRPVEDITEDELELVADNMTHKIYNSATVSVRGVHWRDTTVKVLPSTARLSQNAEAILLTIITFIISAGLHLPSVSSENHRHQDVLPQRGLPRDSGSVLWPVSEEPVRGGCQKGAARSGQTP